MGSPPHPKGQFLFNLLPRSEVCSGLSGRKIGLQALIQKMLIFMFRLSLITEKFFDSVSRTRSTNSRSYCLVCLWPLVSSQGA